MVSSKALLAAAAAQPDPEASDTLLELAAIGALNEAIQACTRCPLYETSTQRVPWNGVRSAIALVGEAPGAQEDRQGAPFVGKAGRFLDSVLSSIGLSRERVALINTICCRPPGNDYDQARSMGAIDACAPWFRAQLAMSGAWVVVPMGNAALWKFKYGGAISQFRGRGWWDGEHYIMPTYHPAYGLRNPYAADQIVQDLTPLANIARGVADLPKPADALALLARVHHRPLDPKLRKAYRRQGWVAIHSPVLGCQVVMVSGEDVVVPDAFAHLVRYTDSEIVKLAGASIETKQRIHLIKAAMGARLVV